MIVVGVPILLLKVTHGRAQPVDTYGIGSRSVALGGAVTADVGDFSANYYNPAGLARAKRVEIAVGYFGAFHELSVNGLDSNVDPVRGLITGMVVPGQISDFRFAFGLGLHLNDDHVSRTRALPSRRPRWEFYDNRPRRIFLAAHLAFAPFEWLRLGGGISFLSFSKNRLALRGNLDVLQAEQRSQLEHSIQNDLTAIRYPQVGIQIEPLPGLHFGVVYRGEFALNNTLDAQVGCEVPDDPTCTTPLLFTGVGMPFPGYFSLETSSVNAFFPQQISGGVAWSPTSDFRIGFELTWVDWSAYVSPVGRSNIILRIAVPESLRDRIRIPESIQGSTPQPARFEDRFVPRFGVEGTFWKQKGITMQGRGGFFYESSPVPNQGELTNLIDTDRWAFSIGLGIRLDALQPLIPGFLQSDFHFQYSLLPERVTRKASLVDPVGDHRAQGHIFAGGLTLSLGLD